MPFSASDIRYLLEVARQGHVGRAAQALGVTQPAVSKAIRRLEEAVGVVLFERGVHGARLTGEGLLFVESARRFHAQHAELERDAAELRARHAGLLRVGLTNASGDTLAVRALSEMVRRRPGLRLSVTIGRSDALNAAVERGELDLAIVPAYPGLALSCAQQELGEDRARVAVRCGHPLLRLPEPTLADLADYGWILPDRKSAGRRLLMQLFERAGAPAPRVTLEVEYMSEAAMGMLAATDLLAVAPTSTLRAWAGRIETLVVPLLEIRRSVVLLARPQATWSPLMLALREALLDYRAHGFV